MASPNLNALLAVFLRQLQKAEDALAQVILVRFLGFAEGVNLDAIGRLVGEPRLGKNDADFRKAIRLRIYINGSSGRPEDLIAIARAVTGFQNVQYLDVTAGNCRLVIPEWTPDDGTLLAFLQSICPAGVRLLYVTNTEAFVQRRFGDRFNLPFSHP